MLGQPLASWNRRQRPSGASPENSSLSGTKSSSAALGAGVHASTGPGGVAV